MTLPTDYSKIYTDAPEQHPNLVLGSLQLLFWLLFRPSAWRNHVARIDSNLRPDFCLAELNRNHWRHPILRRLLIQAYIILPILPGLLVGCVLLLRGEASDKVALGVESGVAFGVAFGVASGVAFGVASGVVYAVIHGMEIDVASGVEFGVEIGVAGSIAKRERSYSLGRQIGGVVVGILVGIVASRVAYGVALDVAFGVAFGVAPRVEIGVAYGVAYGVVLGVAIGLRTNRWLMGVGLGVGLGVVSGVVSSVASSVESSVGLGVGLGVLFSSFFTLPYAITERIAGTLAGVVAGALGNMGLWFVIFYSSNNTGHQAWLFVIGTLLGLTWVWWLYPLQLAFNTLLYQAEQRRSGSRSSLLCWHSAFWHEHQRLRLFGLDEHIVLVTERNPTEGQAAIEYLNNSRQRWAAQAAQIELDIRSLERCAGVETIRKVHPKLEIGEIETPISPRLRFTKRISEDVDAALNQNSSYNQRLVLRAVADRIDAYLEELNRSSDKYAPRFYNIAKSWREIIIKHADELAREAELRQEIESPYVLAVPLTQEQLLIYQI
ncbi:hypothetical protein ACE1AT_19720 [Pelatocladus sp. BLCC-F211]|uniref:hypothetical protein n=1 Tax=Pelatocladus sp. BLCC-F211 TaxID=3342752 RepID=UPI0035B9F77E